MGAGAKTKYGSSPPWEYLIADSQINGIPQMKFGFVEGLGTSVEDIWSAGGTYVWPQAAATIEVLSANVNDTSAGSGARTIRVYGLDTDFNQISEDFTLNGTTVVGPSNKEFRRVYRAAVTTVGTYTGTNAGIITIRIASAGNTLAEIPATVGHHGAESTTHMTHFTVPAGYTGYLRNLRVGVAASKAVSVVMKVRYNAGNTTTMSPAIIFINYPEVAGEHVQGPDIPIAFPEKTDIWWSAVAVSGSSNEVAVSYEIPLIRNGTSQ